MRPRRVGGASRHLRLPYRVCRPAGSESRAGGRQNPKFRVICHGIEHSILHLLGQEQALADGVLDGEGDLSALKMPSGRGAVRRTPPTRPPAASNL